MANEEDKPNLDRKNLISRVKDKVFRRNQDSAGGVKDFSGNTTTPEVAEAKVGKAKAVDGFGDAVKEVGKVTKNPMQTHGKKKNSADTGKGAITDFFPAEEKEEKEENLQQDLGKLTETNINPLVPEDKKNARRLTDQEVAEKKDAKHAQERKVAHDKRIDGAKKVGANIDATVVLQTPGEAKAESQKSSPKNERGGIERKPGFMRRR